MSRKTQKLMKTTKKHKNNKNIKKTQKRGGGGRRGGRGGKIGANCWISAAHSSRLRTQRTAQPYESKLRDLRRALARPQNAVNGSAL